MTTYIYLHGFASGPQSNKAQYLWARFAEIGINLNVLDLNQGDFTHLTLTRQIEQTIAAFPHSQSPITLIGSSFGGLTAAWVAEKCPQVTKLILLAPAFGFPNSWLSRLNPAQVKQWQESGYLPVYHYGEEQEVPLNYQFLKDAECYPLSGLKRSLPTTILHGINDDVVPIQVSRDYARQHTEVKLIELLSDHGLNDMKERIWQEIQVFMVGK
ncbi:YqiA/YcfP family alpha/beta fold hydrolase [Pleurocapsa sp. PCC 7319]|uniref:YqiA/YcfP family alpha/beta fold hydrolase n=1 Tax=Pleurocapsa sp. PCC 7319 TaxID=118161 RepID=UPI000349C6EC|nr:YqiA/YcfP family alpha/beta fold hydrolase [Pleurocapsa sp. PCC 7319]